MSTFRSSSSNTLGVHVGPIDKPRHKVTLEDLERAARCAAGIGTTRRWSSGKGRPTQCPLWAVRPRSDGGRSLGGQAHGRAVAGGKRCELGDYTGSGGEAPPVMANVLCEASRANLSGAGSHHENDRPADRARALAPAAAPPPPRAAAALAAPGLARGGFRRLAGGRRHARRRGRGERRPDSRARCARCSTTRPARRAARRRRPRARAPTGGRRRAAPRAAAARRRHAVRAPAPDPSSPRAGSTARAWRCARARARTRTNSGRAPARARC